MSKFYPLTVLDVSPQTKNAVCVSFDVPEHLYETFNYKPGQYLTLKFNLNNEEVRRSYSLASSPSIEEPLKIGVKRVKNGLVSNHINDNLKAGDTVEVMVPDGRFYANVKEDNYKSYYLFAAGSGITPVISILKTVLYTEPHSHVYMIYGNSNQDTIMFQQELETLQSEYTERFALIHTLSRPKSSWSDLWSTEKSFRKGRVDDKAVEWFINEFPPYAQNAEYFICGPGAMIENTKKALQNMDVPNNRIFIESFGGATEETNIKGVSSALLNATLHKQKASVTMQEGQTVLRALIANNYDPPYSCEGGVCSTCVCKIKKGKVHMKHNMALSEEEVQKGYILSCQSIPLTEEIVVEY